MTPFEQRPTAIPDCVGDPYYCLLAFGPEAERHVWLAFDDEHIYVDRHANGDLAEAGKRVRFPAKRYGVPIDAGEVYPAGTMEPVRLREAGDILGSVRNSDQVKMT